jgi:trehalose 6-phosphate phosphatase
VTAAAEQVAGTGAELRIAIAAFAARPRVLVAVDFDGTLAPFALDPMQARAVPGALEALLAAAAFDGVTVAVVSGRDLETLAALTGLGPGDGIALIGSHGAQASPSHDDDSSPGEDCEPANLQPARSSGLLNEDATALLDVVGGELEAIRSRYPAVRLEHKPAAVAIHTRGVEPSVAEAAEAATHEVGSRYPDVHVMPGKDVVELTVLDANKGTVLVELARSTSSDATLYFGDDVTDERAFAVLDPASGDLAVKVGDGETLAAHRVPDPGAVLSLLELFVDQRRTQD